MRDMLRGVAVGRRQIPEDRDTSSHGSCRAFQLMRATLSSMEYSGHCPLPPCVREALRLPSDAGVLLSTVLTALCLSSSYRVAHRPQYAHRPQQPRHMCEGLGELER